MNTDIVVLLVSAFGFAASAGLASVLRKNEPLTVARVCSATLNSGLVGLAIVLVWYTQFKENVYFLLGVSIIAGLGGTSTIDFVLELGRKWLLVRTGMFNKEEKKND